MKPSFNFHASCNDRQSKYYYADIGFVIFPEVSHNFLHVINEKSKL